MKLEGGRNAKIKNSHRVAEDRGRWHTGYLPTPKPQKSYQLPLSASPPALISVSLVYAPLFKEGGGDFGQETAGALEHFAVAGV